MQVLKEQLGVSFFALLKGVDSAGIEKEFAPCVRLTTLGTRAIMMTPFHHMLTYMEANKVPIHDFSIKQVRDYFMGMTSESLDEYKNVGSLFHLILPSYSMLYVPAGYLFVERANRLDTSFGVKLTVCNRSSGSAEGLRNIKVAKNKSKTDTKVISSLLAESTAQSSTS